MISLTRLNGSKLVVNAYKIKFVEETPDTIITLEGNEKIMVKEEPDEVVSKVVDFIRSTRHLPLD